MTDAPATSSDETPSPETQPEITVGEVNATFPAIPEEPATAAAGADVTAGEGGPPPLIAAPPARDRTWGCLRDVLMMLVSILLGAILALGILLAVNGTLSLNEREKTTLLETEQHTTQSRQEKLQQQVAAQQQQVTAQQQHLATLDARTQAIDQRLQAAEATQQANQTAVATLQAQTEAMSQTTDALQQQISDAEAARKSLAGHVESLDEDVSEIQDSVASFEEEAARFDQFMQGLFTLISDLAPTQATTTPQATATPQPPQAPTPEAPTPPVSEMMPPARALPRPNPGRSIIAGVIWVDVNNDGIANADDRPLPGVWVSLADASDKVLLSMVTGSDGHFAFLNIAPGEYFVTITPVDGLTPATASQQIAITKADSTVEVDFRMLAEQ